MDSWGVFTLFYKVHSPIPSDSGEGKVPTIGNSSDRGPASQLSTCLDISEENHSLINLLQKSGWGDGEGVFAVGWAYLVDVDFGIGW